MTKRKTTNKKAVQKATNIAAETVYKPSVLVVGATSQLGQILVKQLYYDPDVKFIIATGIEPSPVYFTDFDTKKFRYLRVDITKTRDLKNLFYSNLFKDVKIDSIIHLAIRNRPKERGVRAAHRLNISGTQNLLEMAYESDQIKKFIFNSSHIVYRAEPTKPVFIDETAELNFESNSVPWVRDRVDADLICTSRMQDPKLDIIVLRFSNIVGHNFRRFFNTYLNSLVAFYPLGFDPMLNLLHPRDAVRAIQMALKKTGVHGVFNIAGKETGPLSVIAKHHHTRRIGVPGRSLLLTINRIQRRLHLTRFYLDADINRIYYSCLLDGTRAKEILGYEPVNHIELSVS